MTVFTTGVKRRDTFQSYRHAHSRLVMQHDDPDFSEGQARHWTRMTGTIPTFAVVCLDRPISGVRRLTQSKDAN
jgi:hypothetical protein